jgi:hypothetical protein
MKGYIYKSLFGGRVRLELSWRDGIRAWVRRGEDHYDGDTLQFEFARARYSTASIDFSVGGRGAENALAGHFGLWPWVLHWSIDSKRLNNLIVPWVRDDRSIGAYIVLRDGSVDAMHASYYLWLDRNGDDSKLPAWRRGFIRPIELLFGPSTYLSWQTGTMRTREVTFDGRAYVVSSWHERSEWWRPRWPFGAWMTANVTRVTCTEGIPIPGKGENAHDIDDDAMHEHTFNELLSTWVAIERFAREVAKVRMVRGGAHWSPSPREETPAGPSGWPVAAPPPVTA